MPQDNLNHYSVALSGIRAQTRGVNQGGDIEIRAKNVSVTGGAQIINSALDGEGAGGKIHIDVAETVQLSGAFGFVNDRRNISRSEISSGTLGPGDGGEIRIKAKNVELLNGAMIVSTTGGRGSGNAGQVIIDAVENVSLSGFISVIDRGINNTSKTQEISSRVVTGAFEISGRNENMPLGNAGDITVTAKNVVMKDGAEFIAPSSGSAGPVAETVMEIIANTPEEHRPRAGNITVVADNLTVSGARLVGGSGKFSWVPTSIRAGAVGPAGTGNVSLEANTIVISDGANISAETESRNPGVQRGIVTITAHESLSLSGFLMRTDFPENPIGSDPFPEANGRTIRPTSIVARTSGTNQGGDIILSAKNLIIAEGARISNGTLNHQLENSGAGGKIILVADHITMSDMAPVPDAIGRPLPSTISSSTQGPGHAGQIDITSKTIEIKSGGQISASSIPRENAIGAGAGGNIQVVATESFRAEGVGILEGTTVVRSGLFSSTEGPGPGGNILVSSPIIEMKNGAAISASTTGTGNAGDILITAGDSILLDKASVTTEAESAVGGNIKLTADKFIQLTDSQVTSRVQVGSGSAGSINFDPDFIVLKNSKVLSTAEFGDGGPITLIANSAILIDSFSELNANSQFGGSGTIDIQAPIQNLSGTIAPLPQDPAPVTALYGSRCVAGEGGRFSTFVDSKADSLAPRPGTFLASPFLPFSSSSNAVALSHARTPSGVSGISHASHLQVAAYSPPVLFGHGNGMLSACP